MNVVQEILRTGLGIPVGTKKNPLSNDINARGTTFWL